MRAAWDILLENVPMNGNIYSPPIPLSQQWGYAFQAFFTGVPNGQFKVQISADGNTSGDPVNWSDHTDSYVTVTEAGDLFYDAEPPTNYWARLVYTDYSLGTSNAVLTLLQYNSKGH